MRLASLIGCALGMALPALSGRAEIRETTGPASLVIYDSNEHAVFTVDVQNHRVTVAKDMQVDETASLVIRAMEPYLRALCTSPKNPATNFPADH